MTDLQRHGSKRSMARTLVNSICMMALIATPGSALAWRSYDWLQVNPVSETVFEVVGQPRSGGPQYWCAAGEYAFQVLGASTTDQLYLVRGRGPAVTVNRRSAVHFSLVKPDAPPPAPSYSLSVTVVGEAMSVAVAWNYCNGRVRSFF